MAAQGYDYQSTNFTPASHLILFNELATQAVGAKVRFRGCVSNYDAASGDVHLTAKHPMPPAVALDTSLVRERAKGSVLDVGSWISAIGYVTAHGQDAVTRVQAVSVWSEDAVGEEDPKLAVEYDEGVKARKLGMALMKASRDRDEKERAADERRHLPSS